MRCAYCPLYSSWSNENDSGESCVIFGDSWDSRFQYEDKHGTTLGCYLEKVYINKVEKARDEYYADMVRAYKESEEWK